MIPWLCRRRRESGRANRFYEVKYFDPNSIVVDITETGWGGAVKDAVALPTGEDSS